MAEANSPSTNLESIASRTDFLLRLKFMEDAVADSMEQVQTVKINTVFQRDPQCVEALRLQDFGLVYRNGSFPNELNYWKEHEVLYHDLFKIMSSRLAEGPPPTHCENICRKHISTGNRQQRLPGLQMIFVPILKCLR